MLCSPALVSRRNVLLLGESLTASSVAELRNQLRKLNQSTRGSKEELIQRIASVRSSGAAVGAKQKREGSVLKEGEGQGLHPFRVTNKSFPKGAVGGVCALNQPDLCQFFMDDNENSVFAVLTEHVLQKYESSTGSIPLTLHHRKGSGARLLLVEEDNRVKDFAHVVVDSSGLLQLSVFKKVAEILRVALLKKNETLNLKVGYCRWAQSPSTALQGKVVTIRISNS
jgi:hypothetical protein